MKKNVLSFAVLLLLLNFVLMTVSAQIPYVYNVENTGAGYPAPPLPTFADCPVIVPLPDPFAWASDPLGVSPVRTTAFSDWSHHRAEIKAQIENYEIGLKPAVDPSQISASFSGNTLTVVVTVGTESLTLTSNITLPSGDGPFPVVIGMNGNSLPATAFTSRNIAQMTFSANQVSTYGSPQNTNPYYRLYPDQNIDNSGQYAAWSWGVSRLIDGLYLTQATNKIDVAHIAVTGCSYAGKMALFAGAFDERIALTIPQESGGGGVASWRYSYTQSGVEGLAQTDHNWFKDSMFDFGGENVSKLPEDHHMLCAMVAPRALYITGNKSQIWLSNEACYVSSRAVQRIYETLGIADRFGFSITDNHNHCTWPTSENASLYYFLDKYMLGDTDLSQIIETAPDAYAIGDYAVDYERWTHWWGTGEAILPDLPEKPDGEGIWLEAECGTVGADWRVVKSSLVSHGKFIVGDADNHTPISYATPKLAVYNFTITEAGRYNVLIRVHCQTADDDSFHWRFNSAGWAYTNGLATGDDWKWVLLGTSGNLAAGDHTLSIAIRENGAELDKIFISLGSFASDGFGPDTDNCPIIPDLEFPDFDEVNNIYYVPGMSLADISLAGMGTGDGTYAWEDPTTVLNAGDYSYNVVFTPNPATILLYDYSDIELTQPVSLTINPRNINNAAVTISITITDGNPVYTGQQLTPAFTTDAMDGSSNLTSADYDYSYGYNINVLEGGGIVFSGKGNYTGTKTLSFVIQKAPVTITLPEGESTTYTGFPIGISELTLSGSLTVNSLLSGLSSLFEGIEGTEYASSSTVPILPGKYKVTVFISGDSNHESAVAGTTFTILKVVPNPVLDDIRKPYDGLPTFDPTDLPQDLEIRYFYEGYLYLGDFYPFTSIPPVDAGNYTEIIEIDENAIYESRILTTHIIIERAEQVIDFPAIPVQYVSNSPFYLEAQSRAGLALSYSIDDITVAEVTAGGLVTPKAVGTAYITAQHPGSNNYTEANAGQILKVQDQVTSISIADAEKDIAVYPNPVSGNSVVTLDCGITDEKQLNGSVIEIYNISGSLLETLPVKEKITQVKTKQPGIYFYVFKTKDGLRNYLKVIVK